ncbi:MAG: hypothetical protein ABI599_00880 [Flavobacteriales bacterium]
MRKVLKYGLLLVPAVLALYVLAPIGDRCSGLAHALGALVLAAGYALIFLVITVLDVSRLLAGRKGYDLIPLIITCVFIGAFWSLPAWGDEKPWTRQVFSGQADVGDARSASLRLYANGTFSAQTAYADWSCTYTGRYEWENGTLTLLREDLPSLTDSAFTNMYRFAQSDSTWLPFAPGFASIRSDREPNGATGVRR